MQLMRRHRTLAMFLLPVVFVPLSCWLLVIGIYASNNTVSAVAVEWTLAALVLMIPGIGVPVWLWVEGDRDGTGSTDSGRRSHMHEDDLHPAIEDWFARRLEFMPCDDDLEMHDALLMAAHAISASLNAHPTLANVKAIAAALGIGDDGGRVIDGEIAKPSGDGLGTYHYRITPIVRTPTDGG